MAGRRRGRVIATGARCSRVSGWPNLLDPGAPFLEIGATAGHGMYDGAAPAGGVIAGVGRVQGQDVMVVCNDATVKGGDVLSDLGQETSARARDRRGLWITLCISCG